MRSLRTISMQMDREFEKEQIGTLFDRGGAVLGAGGGRVLLGVPPSFCTMVPLLFFYPPVSRNKQAREVRK